MMFRIFALTIFFIVSYLSASQADAAEDLDWIFVHESILESGSESPEIGKFWALGARKDDIQISFRLEATTDMKKGGWFGDFRAPEKFYVKFYFIDAADKKWYFKLKNARAVGSDSEYGRWKEGPATASTHMMMYDFSWDEMQIIKDAKTIVLGYTSFDKKDETKDIVISMENFNTRLNELERSVRSVKGGSRFVMTEEQMKEEVKIAHQAIYDQEPKWFDINICPKPDVGYCNNIGKKAYLESSMIDGGGEKFSGAMTVKYGKINGVIWRSKGSIIEILPGDIKWNRDPVIIRAPKAEYYYIIKDGDTIKIKPAADIYAKG